MMQAPGTTTLLEATEKLRGYLKLQGLRLTPERLELLRIALRSPGHFDADELVARFRRSRRRVSRATIYRTLTLLEQCGILRKSLRGQGRGVYETALGRGHHDHIVCASCGRIDEFYDERIESIQDQIAEELGFQLFDHIHELFGLCRRCRNGERGSRSSGRTK